MSNFAEQISITDSMRIDFVEIFNGHRYPCSITFEALDVLEPANDFNYLDTNKAKAIFLKNRPLIHSIAQKKYDNGDMKNDMINIQESCVAKFAK